MTNGKLLYKKINREIILLLFTLIFSNNLLIKAQDLEIDLNRVPFSSPGSYFAISTLKNRIPQDTIYINHFLGLETRQIFKVLPLNEDNSIVKYNINATPWNIKLNTVKNEVDICFENPQTIRIKSFHNGFKLSSDLVMSFIPMPNKKQFRILGKDRYDRFMVTCLKGDAIIAKKNLEYEITVTPLDSLCELVIEEYVSEWIPREYKKSFDDCVKDIKNGFEYFIRKSPNVNSKYEEAKNLALYINWSSTVYPRGFMHRYGMLMSKNWMNYIWSWDNCFNAIGMANNYPNLAWDQIMVVLENQDELGILPDRFRDVFIHYGFTKPPIYGYAISQLENVNEFMNQDRYKEIYPYLFKLTEFWLKYRDDNKNGLPEYHHGNDSGWDNATVFDIGFPIEGPDLSAFLVIQMDKLSEIALKIGNEKESMIWKLKADSLFKKMMNEFWKEDRFIYKNSLTNKYVEKNQSLLEYIPIVLAKRLPVTVQKKMINNF